MPSGTKVTAQMGYQTSGTKQVDPSSQVRPTIKLRKSGKVQSKTKSASMLVDVGEGPSRSMEDEFEASIQMQPERIPLKTKGNKYKHISSSEASSDAGDESGSESESDDSDPPVKRSRVKNRRSQDGGLEHSSRLVTTRDVDVQAGHEGCLFLCECSTGTQTVPEICVAGENIPVPLPPVRFGVRPENIHKAIKASHGDTAACGNEGSNLPGRPFIDERDQAGSAEQSRHSHLASNISGVCDKHGEVSFGPITKAGISRFFNRFTRYALLSPTQESSGHQNKLCDVAQERGSDSARCCKSDRSTDRLCSSSVFSTAALSPSTDGKNQDITGKSQLRGTIDLITRSETGTPLVESPSGDMEWEKFNNSRPRHDFDNRCVKTGLGGNLGQ